MSNALRPENAEEVPVTWEDQQKINAFGRLFTRLQDLNDEIQTKKTECEALTDAESEVDNLFDEDACKVKIGEIFFNLSNDDAMEYIKNALSKKKLEYAALLDEKTTITKEIDELKKALYAKFGSSISLDG